MDRIPNLRSGIGHPTLNDAVEDVEMEHYARRMISLVAVMTQQAAQIATVFAEHNAPEEGVTNGTINKALMYQAKHFLQSLDDDTVVQDVLMMEHCIFDFMDEEDKVEVEDAPDLEDNITLAMDDNLPVGHPERYTQYTAQYDDKTKRCTCELCASIYGAVDTWNTWAPEDEVEMYLRNSVERAIDATTVDVSQE